MTPLEKVNSMKMPFAELKGVTFTDAGKDRVVARMLVRPDLCTLGHTIHGGALMALADSVGAAATVINLPEDAKGGITVNAICPGYINTEMVQAVPKEVLEKSILPLIPVNRLGEPDEIARAVVFLAADEAGAITGSTLSINGGQYMV